MTLAGTALLLVDLQLANFDPQAPIDQGDLLLERAAGLAGRARAAGVPVIFVQHEGPPGSWDEPGAPGFEIHPALSPQPDEPLVRKRTPDSFHETELQATLDHLGVTQLVVAGLQTEYCIDTTCRRAWTLGYDVTLVGDAHSSWDGGTLTAAQIIAHHNATLGGWFVTVEESEAILFEQSEAAQPA